MKKRKGVPPHPIQPLVDDGTGVTRFKGNAIVRHLLDWSQECGHGLNELAAMDFTPEDHEQFAQLINYSLSGFSELSYVSDATYDEAESSPVFDNKPTEDQRILKRVNDRLVEQYGHNFEQLVRACADVLRIVNTTKSKRRVK